jgi:LacI family transcriptional regulator
MPPPTTLQDVADRAQVHRSTVALALRVDPRIPPATRQKLQVLAKNMGYRENPLVRALMQSRRSGRAAKNMSIAFVTNYPTRLGWKPEHHDRPDFFPGAAAKAKDCGYNFEHFWLREPGMTPARFCNVLRTRDIHGVVLARLPPDQHSLELEWEHFSCVALGVTLLNPQLHHVTENHFNTVWQGMQQCLDRGYRRVGFVFSEANDSPPVGDRWRGAYLSQQLKFPAQDRLPICPGVPTNQETFTKWFCSERPDALLVNRASPAKKWLHALDKEVPRDVGLVELEGRRELGNAGVYYDPEKIGALAVEIVSGMMQRNETGIPKDPEEILLSGEWRAGSTLPSRNG